MPQSPRSCWPNPGPKTAAHTHSNTCTQTAWCRLKVITSTAVRVFVTLSVCVLACGWHGGEGMARLFTHSLTPPTQPSLGISRSSPLMARYFSSHVRTDDGATISSPHIRSLVSSACELLWFTRNTKKREKKLSSLHASGHNVAQHILAESGQTTQQQRVRRVIAHFSINSVLI